MYVPCVSGLESRGYTGFPGTGLIYNSYLIPVFFETKAIGTGGNYSDGDVKS